MASVFFVLAWSHVPAYPPGGESKARVLAHAPTSADAEVHLRAARSDATARGEKLTLEERDEADAELHPEMWSPPPTPPPES